MTKHPVKSTQVAPDVTGAQAPRQAVPGDGVAPPTGSPLHIDFLPPQPDLAGYVTTFFSVQSDLPRISDVLPATIPLLLVFVHGRGRLQVAGRDRVDSHPASLITPLAQAARFDVEGPLLAYGATITPLGWAALTRGASARHLGNRLVEAGSLLGDHVTRLGDWLVQRHRTGPLDLAAMAATTAQVLLERAVPPPPRHAAAIRAVVEWLGTSLSPHVDDLTARTGYSARQLQRLVDQYYGVGPKQLARKYRAQRAAALLGKPQVAPDLIAHVEDQFYDQSHMIREIRHFTGSTPGRLTLLNRPVMAASLEWGAPYHLTAMPPNLQNP